MHGNRKYNWEGLFERGRTTLRRGVDYHCSQSTMVGMVRVRASQRRVSVRVADNGDSITVEVRGAIPHPDKAAVAVE